MPAAIGLLEVEFILPGSTSLKDKRRVLRSLKDRLLNKRNVSVAEVGHQDLIGRCHLAVVTVSSSRADAQQRLAFAEELIASHPEAEVIERQVQWL